MLRIVSGLRDRAWYQSTHQWFRMTWAQRVSYRVAESSLSYRWYVFLGRLLDRLISHWGARC